MVRTSVVGFIGMLLAACDIVPQASPLLSNAPQHPSNYTVETTVTGRPPHGDFRSVRAGSRWVEFGSIAEGTVYKPLGTVMTVEGINISEAYIVVRGRSWVGFWLPVEKGFVPLEKVAPVALRREE
jgi:hypothetical protein